MNEALTVSHDMDGATPGLAAASQSASGLSRFTVSTHSPSTESPFHSHASKLSSPSAMGVSGLSRINSPSLSRINAQRLVIGTACLAITHTHAYHTYTSVLTAIFQVYICQCSGWSAKGLQRNPPRLLNCIFTDLMPVRDAQLSVSQH